MNKSSPIKKSHKGKTKLPFIIPKKAALWVLVAVSCALIAALVLNIRAGYYLPNHLDEWQHLGLARNLVETGQLLQKNPYYSDVQQYNPEPGFTIFTAATWVLLNDPLYYAAIMPAIFSAWGALMVYILTRKITGSATAGLYALLLYGGIRSNVNILGEWFYTPMNLALPLTYATLLLMIRALYDDDKKAYVSAAITAAAVVLIHPPSALAILASFALAIAAEPSKIKSRKMAAIILLPAAIGLVLLVFYAEMKGGGINFILNAFQFSAEWGTINFPHNPFTFYGIGMSMLAALGAIILLKKKTILPVLFAAFPIAVSYVYIDANIAFFIPFQRAIYLSAVGLVPLTAVGLDALIKAASDFVGRALTGGKPSLTQKMLPLLAVVIVLYVSFDGYYNVPKEFSVYLSANPYDVDALRALDGAAKQKVVLTDPWSSAAVYPITGGYVVAMRTGKLWGRNYTATSNFYNNHDCQYQTNFMRTYDVSYLISKQANTCGFKEIYSNRGNHVYEVKR
ncbi:Dolichyl-phosphate-mannose-protein mannosyltransferase [uncultured archaeon]|nr:Dolichyl-phosphate-mannose-protein mannosyltransferase [uncultured archaeon]